MTSNERITQTLLAVLFGRLSVWSSEPGYCLRVVRLVLMNALGITYDEFAARYWTHEVDDNDTGIPWARTMQRSLREGSYGMLVPYAERRAGDLAFNSALAREGHVALIVQAAGGETMILENTHSQRGRVVSGYNRESRLEDWPRQGQIEIYRLVEP